MAIQITPEQIPVFWEAIKFASVNADHVVGENVPRYLNKLLYELLSSNAQCFVHLDNARKLQALAITKVLVDEITEERILFLKTLYSFNYRSVDAWNMDFQTLVDFARRKGCRSVVAWTNNPRVMDMARVLGFSERLKSFKVDI